MNTRLITRSEIAERQWAISNEFRRSQQTFSIAGFRHLLGSTFIALGTRIHGCLEERREASTVRRPFTPARGI